jgi:arsenite methyltransferase
MTIENQTTECCAQPCGCSPAETAQATRSAEIRPSEDPRAVVRERYGRVAAGEAAHCCSAPCGCNGGDVGQVLESIGYSADQAAAIPEGANLGLGCGNPTALAEIQPGETVLDLGSGAGIDCFLAARATGPTGRVIGVDMTPAMIDRARANARQSSSPNVDFRLGEIEHLPVADASVDLIVSNCVVNLSPDKPQVFREAHRALKPGGRLMVSDLVLLRPLEPELQRSVDLYVGCVAGAAVQADYLRMIAEAGFTAVEVVREGRYEVGASSLPPESPEGAAFEVISSITVRARKA